MTSTCFPDFLAEAVATGSVAPFALASVDGGASYWHRRTTGEDRMAMLLRDFLPMLADRHGLDRGPVALVGWSMGGYGAILGAEEHPERFVAVAAASPAIFRTYDEMLAGAGDAFDSPEDFSRHDVIANAARLAGIPVRVDCGTRRPVLRERSRVRGRVARRRGGFVVQGVPRRRLVAGRRGRTGRVPRSRVRGH
jgi:pimeloyl-ACP methyl ester carboxylesterase